MDGFRYNPSAGSVGGGLKVLPPEIYNNQNIASVQLVLPDGTVIEQGKYHRVADGRKNYGFSRPGWAYPSDVQVRVLTADGKSQLFNPRDGIKSHERGPSGAPGGGGGNYTSQDGGGNPTGGISQGEDFSTFDSNGGNQVAIPNFVNFDPAAYQISLDEAIGYGRAEGQFNLGLFQSNFNKAGQYALDTQQTELQGLESFLPRTTNLIRNADRQGNEDITNYSDVFDARNEKAMRKATQGNVALRTNIAEQAFPGTFKSVQGMRTRAEGDVARVRERESTSFVDDVLKEQAARKARGVGADIASSTGFGADSSAGMNILDTFEVDRRLQIEQSKREDFRRGDQAIYGAEAQVANSVIQGQNLFNTVIAPGIRDFTPIQAMPRVTDIGAQIRPMPTVDAGTLQHAYTNEQNQVSMLSPSQVFSGSIDTQKYNSGVGLQALGFEQQQNNIIAGAANTGINQDKGDLRFQQQLDAQQEALAIRADSQNNVATTQAITAGLGVLGGLASSYLGSSGDQQQGQQQGIGQAITNGIKQYGSQFYNAASDYLKETFGLDIGQFDVAPPQNSAGGGGGGSTSSGGGSPKNPNNNGNIFSGVSDMSGVVVNAFPNDTTYGGQSTADYNANSQAIDDHFSNITQNDFTPNVLGDPSFNLESDSFDWGDTQQGYQADEFNLDTGDIFSYDGGLSSNDSNEYVNLARTSKSASGVEVIPKKEIVDSFVDPSLRSSVAQKAEQKGLSTSTVLQGYALFDNWNSLSEKDRAASSAQFAIALADEMSVVDGAIPGAVVTTLRQGANVFENWDKLNEGQKVAAGTNFVGGISALAAQVGGAAGPVGMGITLAAAAYGHAAEVLLTTGIDGKTSFAAVETPLSSHVTNSVNNALGKPLSKNDAANVALFTDPTGIGTAVAAADMIFDLDLDFTSGKPKTQQFRDNLRSYLKDNKVIAPDYNWHLSDGSTFDMGKDGKAKLKNIGKNIDGKTERSYSDVDHSNPIAPQTTAWADVVSILGFRSTEGKKFTGNLWNAATNKEPTNMEQAKDNFKGMAHDMGLNYNKGIQILNAMKDQFKPGEYEAYKNSWMTLNLK